MIDSRDAMVSVLGFTGVLGGGWRWPHMVVPYEGQSAGFQHCAVHLLGWCLRRLLRGYESLRADHRVHAARARSIWLRQCSIVGLTPKVELGSSARALAAAHAVGV